MFHKKKDKTPAAFTSKAMEMTVLSPEEDRGFILERQIHEQYSSNSNAHISSFLSFVGALLALFGAFGCVYAKTVNIFHYGTSSWPETELLNTNTSPQHLFTLDSFLWLSAVVSIMLCFLACLCVYLGFAERRDQIQQYYIRKRHGVETVYSNPCEKQWGRFMNEYYRMFFRLLLVLQVLVIIICAYRILPILSCQ